MLGACRWLALEVKYLDPILEFYQNHLSMELVRKDSTEGELDAGGESSLILRRPSGVPRGGLHTHYAFACPEDTYEAWYASLEDVFDLQEEEFGSMTSLYFYDPEGNCVEIGSIDDPTGDPKTTLTGIFEVVLEVESLPAAESFYQTLGFEIVDRGEKRMRTRLTNGPFDIELWEPHLGLADARGGVHVDIGIASEDPAAVVDRISDKISSQQEIGDGIRFRDPDCHYITLVTDSS